MDDHGLRVYDSILGLLSGADNPTPLVRLNRVTPLPPHAGLRQAGVVQPVRGGQGPRRGQPHRGRRGAAHGARQAEAGGADVGEHRHGAGDDRERQGLLADDAAVERDPAREAHHAALLRRRRDGAGRHPVSGSRGAGGGHREGDGDRGSSRFSHAEPVRQRGQPGGALQDDRPGDLAPDRRQGHPLRRRSRYLRHHHRHGPLSQGATFGGPGARRLSERGARHPRSAQLPATQADEAVLSGRVRRHGRGPQPGRVRSLPPPEPGGEHRRGTELGHGPAGGVRAGAGRAGEGRRGDLPGQRLQVRVVGGQAPARGSWRRRRSRLCRRATRCSTRWWRTCGATPI